MIGDPQGQNFRNVTHQIDLYFCITWDDRLPGSDIPCRANGLAQLFPAITHQHPASFRVDCHQFRHGIGDPPAQFLRERGFI